MCKHSRKLNGIHPMPNLYSKRQVIAEIVRGSLAPVTCEQQVEDFLLVLAQWESGTLHGIPPVVPPLDPRRPIATHPA